MRNDKTLISGLSSAQERRSAQRAQERANEKRREAIQIKPHTKLILEWIAEEKAKVTNIESIVLDIDNAENLQAQIIAIKMHLIFLDKIQTRVNKLVRTEARHE